MRDVTGAIWKWPSVRMRSGSSFPDTFSPTWASRKLTAGSTASFGFFDLFGPVAVSSFRTSWS